MTSQNKAHPITASNLKPDLKVETKTLSKGGQLLIFSVRTWTKVAQARGCMTRALAPLYQRHGAASSLATFDELMCHLCVVAYRPLEVRCMCDSELSGDEHLLLRALSSVQRGAFEEAKDLMAGVMTGRFRTTFVRIATEYVEELRSAQLKLTSRGHLSLVTDCALPLEHAATADHATHQPTQ